MAFTKTGHYFVPQGAISMSALSIVDDVIVIVDDFTSSVALNGYDIINNGSGLNY